MISVVIPTHARAAQVVGAVQSVLDGARTRVEIVVVEDRTSEAHAALAPFIAAETVRYFHKSEGPPGASATRNLGVAKATGKIILFLDDDDLMLPGYIDQLAEICRDTVCNWGFCDQLALESRSKVRASRSSILTRTAFKTKIAATSAGFWIARAVFNDLGGFDTTLAIDEDTDLCCRLLARGEMPYYLKIAGVRLSRDDGIARLTAEHNPARRAACYMRTLAKNYDLLEHEKGARAFLADRAHRTICKSGDRAALKQLSAYRVGLGLKLVWALREQRYF